GGEDHGLPHRLRGVRCDERGLRRALRRAPAGAVDGPGLVPAAGRADRGRMHRRAPLSPEEPPLPPRATGIFLGVWVAALLFIAFVVVPQLFAVCGPTPQ